MNAPISPGSLAAPITTYSSREFTRDVAAAKRAAANGPVFITDRGAPAYALVTIEEYHRLKRGG
ncbi:MAG: type II toxin-antitoxin system prevent-host-death family antitoxin, partial [Ottowia sp.]|nr:type II toxin-antitoxin system prevent-host-death family antitoxin [Ottowia sp.]